MLNFIKQLLTIILKPLLKLKPINKTHPNFYQTLLKINILSELKMLSTYKINNIL